MRPFTLILAALLFIVTGCGKDDTEPTLVDPNIAQQPIPPPGRPNPYNYEYDSPSPYDYNQPPPGNHPQGGNTGYVNWGGRYWGGEVYWGPGGGHVEWGGPWGGSGSVFWRRR